MSGIDLDQYLRELASLRVHTDEVIARDQVIVYGADVFMHPLMLIEIEYGTDLEARSRAALEWINDRIELSALRSLRRLDRLHRKPLDALTSRGPEDLAARLKDLARAVAGMGASARDLTGYLRARTEKISDDGDYLSPPSTVHACPECAQGKPWNCTGWAIDDRDEMVQCERPDLNEQEQEL